VDSLGFKLNKWRWQSTAETRCREYRIYSTKQIWQVSDAACTLFELLIMSGKPARNMYSTDNNKEYCTRCILLVVLKNEMLYLPSHTTHPPVYLQHFVSATKDILPLGRHHILLPPPKYTHYIKSCPWNLCIVAWNRKTLKRTRNTGGGWKWRCFLWVLWSKCQMCGN